MKARIPLVLVLAAQMVFGQAQLSWVTVRDGRESAFSVDIPKGWKSYGGMFRFGGGLDARRDAVGEWKRGGGGIGIFARTGVSSTGNDQQVIKRRQF